MSRKTKTSNRPGKRKTAKAERSGPLFSKILIANRGEIACRVIRTCRRMGIKTVAVYSDADADALHVRLADEAVRIGPAASAESYLKIDAIVKACRDTGAQAVHPGYGFLSENAAFGVALAKAKIVFIGPEQRAISAMGDKIESKKLAQKAGVTMVPGHLAALKDAEAAVKIAREVGYPVMIKASAGGGGKGMRIARSDAETREGFRLATNEAKSAFGDDRVFIEKYIEQPRHIEIQVLGDKHGNVIHLGERECSIQRRHQKVIEEAPSPFLDAKTRTAMGAQAVALAKAVKYSSAGTVEFIVDSKRNFYFLEMNTRLQVEHPVTECVTGLDLVEQMIRVAAGEKLKLTQADIKLRGWAVEARVYAEDPARNFLPSIGRLTRYILPPTENGVRVDDGVDEGGEISMFYDPMIAKLVGFGADRDSAIDKLADALDAYVIRGLNHNMAFLAAIAAHPRFREGKFSTAFIAEEFPDGFKGAKPDKADEMLLAVIAAVVQRRLDETETATAGAAAPSRYVVRLNGNGGASHDVQLKPGRDDYALTVDGSSDVIRTAWRPGEILLRASLGRQDVVVQVERDGGGWTLTYRGMRLRATALRPRLAELAALMPMRKPPDTSKFLLSPMPGLLKAIAVKEGQEVKAGEELATVEAMKMENILRAPRDAKVTKLHAGSGDSLAVDQKIMEFG